tara:strand:+ start:524 stop:796 length:273 start_codon:yes stop_codon:yes gene_type:complete
MTNKTRVMLRVERAHKEHLETLMPRLINEGGSSDTARKLGISTSLVGYWCMKLGIIKRTIALAPGQRIEVRGVPRIDNLDIGPGKSNPID